MMKILYFDYTYKCCNYYRDIRDVLSDMFNVKVISKNIHREITLYKPDIFIVGFSVTDCGDNPPTLDLNNIDIPLYIILNKEYTGIFKKLDWIKSITPQPKKIFSVHHDVDIYQEYCKIPFHRIMWSANENIFKKYDDNYCNDLFFSGVIRKEQTDNMRHKVYNKLNELKGYSLLVNAAFYENELLKGQLYNMTNEEYAKEINNSKIVLTTTGPGDLVGTRYFEIMASNKALIMCNRMPSKIYDGITKE